MKSNKINKIRWNIVAMKKSKHILAIAFLILFIAESACFGFWGKKPASTIPDGWPEKLDKRNLYAYENTFVYAGLNSEADKINNLVCQIEKQFAAEESQKSRPGLLLVMDIKENKIFDLDNFIEIVTDLEKMKNEKLKAGDINTITESIAKTKKQLKKLGLSMDLLFSMSSMPIEPNMLPVMVKDFEVGSDRKIGWCLIIPSERNMKIAVNTMIDTMLDNEKVDGIGRAIMAPFLPAAKSKALDEIKRARKLAVFQLLLNEKDQLNEQQKQQRIKAYREKIGITTSNNKSE